MNNETRERCVKRKQVRLPSVAGSQCDLLARLGEISTLHICNVR